MEKNSTNLNASVTESPESLPNLSQMAVNDDLEGSQPSLNKEKFEKAPESHEASQVLRTSTQISEKCRKEKGNLGFSTGIEGHNSFHGELDPNNHNQTHETHEDPHQRSFGYKRNVMTSEESKPPLPRSPPREREAEEAIQIEEPLNESAFYETFRPLILSLLRDSFDISAGIQKLGFNQPGLFRILFYGLFSTLVAWVFAFITKRPKFMLILLSNLASTLVALIKMGWDCYSQKKGEAKLRKIKTIIKKYSNSDNVNQLADEIAFEMTKEIKPIISIPINLIKKSRWMKVKGWFCLSRDSEEETAHIAYKNLEKFFKEADPIKLHAEIPTRVKFIERCAEKALKGDWFKVHKD